MSPSVSKLFSITGVGRLVNGKLFCKSWVPSSWLLLAWISSREQPLVKPTSQCLTNTISYSQKPVQEEIRGPIKLKVRTAGQRKTFLERISRSQQAHEEICQFPTGTRSMSPSMLGKSKNKSHLPLSHWVSSKLGTCAELHLWSQTCTLVPAILKMPPSIPKGRMDARPLWNGDQPWCCFLRIVLHTHQWLSYYHHQRFWPLC